MYGQRLREEILRIPGEYENYEGEILRSIRRNKQEISILTYMKDKLMH